MPNLRSDIGTAIHIVVEEHLNSKIEQRIADMQSVLSADPDGLLAGHIRQPWTGERCLADDWPLYLELLHVSDGASIGQVDFWSSLELPTKQFLLPEELERDEGNWLVIGQLLYEVLAMSRAGEVGLAARDAPIVALGSLDRLLEQLLGNEYRLLIVDGEEDEWWGSLEKAGLR